MLLIRVGEGDKWRNAAARLGLRAHRSNASVEACVDWEDMRSAIGNPMTMSYPQGDLMVGTRNGRSVLVALTEVLRANEMRAGRYFVVGFRTHVVSAIEPPLRLGLSLQPTGSGGGGATLPDVQVGHAALDPRYHLASADPTRVRTLLRHMAGPGWDAADTLVQLADLGFHVDVSDSYVRLSKPDRWLEPAQLGAWLDHATWLAGAFADARKQVPPADYEQRYADTIDAVANELGLRADREALGASGFIGHVGVSIYVGSVRGGVYTAVTASIPAPIASALRIDREDGTPAASAPLLGDLLGFGAGAMPVQSDVQVGIPALDTRLRITGYPEANVRWAVRAIGPKLLEVLARARAFNISGNLVRIELASIEMHAPHVVRAVHDAIAIAQGLSSAPPP